MLKRQYDKVIYLYNNGLFPLVLRFSKVTVFHIFFEMLISVYILELFAVFTNFYIEDPTSISKMLVIVFFPLLIALPLSILFGIWIMFHYSSRVQHYHSSKTNNSDTATESDYKSISKKYRWEVIKVHIFGMAFYTLSTFAIPFFLTHNYPSKFINPNGLIVYITGIGSILGAVWNITGIFRNQRLVWSKYLPALQTRTIIEIEKKNNCKYLLLNAVGNIVSLLVLFVLLIVIIFNLHEKLVDERVLRSLTTDYGFLVLSFITLVALYIKIGFNYLYASETENIYPSLKTILALIPSTEAKEDEDKK